MIYRRTKGLTQKETHYCPGCTHGIVHKIVGEVLEELDMLGKTVGVASVGCSVMAYDYFSKGYLVDSGNIYLSSLKER